jgi:zinc protease
MGEAYSPFAWREASSAYRGFGFLAAQVGVAPDLAEQARLAVLAIAADLAAHGVDDQLLAQAKTPVVKSLAAQRQQNQYWLGSVLSRAAAQPFRLDWAATMEADYDAITAAELSDLAKRYLDNDRAFQVVGVCLGK